MRPQILFPLFASVTTLKGVGSQIAQMLARLIHNDEHATTTIRDVLFHLPDGVLDRRASPPIREAKHDTICTFRVKVEAHHPPSGGSKYTSRRPYKVLCSNATGDMTLVFFHAKPDYIKNALPVGTERVISGKVEIYDFTTQMAHPDIIAPVEDAEKVLVIEPQYPLTANLTNKKLRNIVEQSLERMPELAEWLPEAEAKRFGVSFRQALMDAHHPRNETDILPFATARRRLAFDELLAEQLALAKARKQTQAQPGIILPEPTNAPPYIPPASGGDDSFSTPTACGGSNSFSTPTACGGSNSFSTPTACGGSNSFSTPTACGGSNSFSTPTACGGSNSFSTPTACGGSNSFSTPTACGGSNSFSTPTACGGSNSFSTPTACGGGKGGAWLQLERNLPFTLTEGQLGILKEISDGLASGQRFIRLLQGDVGSGKTILALFAMLRACEHGHQAALMVPTEIVARQHFERLKPLIEVVGMQAAFLTGSVKGMERKQALKSIENGEAHIVIGTHALFQEHVNFKSLALVVIDEQHRFGVAQRMALVEKGDKPHLIHMTATPIPRSLMMTLYGDMEALILKDKPHGRKEITTRVVPLSRADELLDRLDAALKRGEKAYWICPQIEDKAADTKLFEQDIAAVEFRFKEFSARFGSKVGLVHGRMNGLQRDEVMRQFMEGDIQLLVATTVIEVGVDVRDATIIIIERAERFGLSQLHQLRGRVGRGEKESFCILLYADAAGEYARERLTTIRNHEDGFTIAEVDFKLRGGGELLGKRQAGQRSYRLASTENVSDMLLEAHQLAEKMGHSPEAETLMELFA